MNERVKYQKQLIEDGVNIEIHHADDSPVPLEILRSIRPGADNVIKRIDGGLTAYIYHIFYDGKDYCSKKKRDEILVKNDDGQLSFLNELLCRKILEEHRDNPVIAKGISQTYYASLKEGFILSEWIHGQGPEVFTREMFRTTFELQTCLEKLGLFEWDMCPGNLLYVDNQLVLFDFGYMYPTDLLKGPNSDGMNNLVFHAVERLETRTLVQMLLDLELKGQDKRARELYRICKEEALKSYNERINYLKANNAGKDVIDHFSDLVMTWQEALEHEEKFEEIYLTEKARSYTLDILDDLHGNTCTKYTLAKIEAMTIMIKEHYEALVEHGALLWSDGDLSKEDLLSLYEDRRLKAIQYQI